VSIMGSLKIANQSDEWVYDLEKKASTLGLNEKEQKQYIKLEEIRDKFYEIYLNNFKKYHQFNCGDIGYRQAPKSCANRYLDKLNIRRNEKLRNDKIKPTQPPIKIVYDEGNWFNKIKHE
jgi:hypothetical protein